MYNNAVIKPFSEPTQEVPMGTAPEFVVMPTPCKVKEGEAVEFTCQVTGEPTAELEWYYKDSLIKLVDRYSLIERDGLQVLTVTDVTTNDVGDYRVIAVNDFGEASCVANLEVEGTLYFLSV